MALIADCSHSAEPSRQKVLDLGSVDNNLPDPILVDLLCGPIWNTSCCHQGVDGDHGRRFDITPYDCKIIANSRIHGLENPWGQIHEAFDSYSRFQRASNDRCLDRTIEAI